MNRWILEERVVIKIKRVHTFLGVKFDVLKNLTVL